MSVKVKTLSVYKCRLRNHKADQESCDTQHLETNFALQSEALWQEKPEFSEP